MPRRRSHELVGAARDRVIEQHLEWIATHGSLRRAVESNSRGCDGPLGAWLLVHERALARRRTASRMRDKHRQALGHRHAETQ